MLLLNFASFTGVRGESEVCGGERGYRGPWYRLLQPGVQDGCQEQAETADSSSSLGNGE